MYGSLTASNGATEIVSAVEIQTAGSGWSESTHIQEWEYASEKSSTLYKFQDQ